MKKIVLAAALAFVSSAALASDMVMTPSDALKWGPAPEAFEKGSELAVLAGDPHQAGPFILRLKMPAGYKINAHNHPTMENVTVISGTVNLGMGDKLDMKKTTALTPGGFVSLPATMNHFVWVAEPTIVQVSAEGPFAITYVNAADDPRNKKK
jgi:quercetin dioxygenase-like cupin family protein